MFAGTNLTAGVCIVAAVTSIIVYPAPGDTTGMLAMGVAVVSPSGEITAVNVLNPGMNYTVPPLVSMPAPPSGGTTATVTSTISGGFVTGFLVGSGGSGYAGSTADGHPIAINSATNALGLSNGGVPCAALSFADATLGESNGTDVSGTPDMTGIWTFVADESAAQYADGRQNVLGYHVRELHSDDHARNGDRRRRDRQDVAVHRDADHEPARPHPAGIRTRRGRERAPGLWPTNSSRRPLVPAYL